MCVRVRGFLTVGEAARLRGFRRVYVLELIRAGRLRSEVLFGRVLVRRSDVERIERGRPGRKPRHPTRSDPRPLNNPAVR